MKMCNQVSPKVEKDDLSEAQLHGRSDKMNNLIRPCHVLWRADYSRKPERGVLLLRRFCLPSIPTAFLDKHLPKRLWIMDGHQDREAVGGGVWGRASAGQGVSLGNHLHPSPMKLGGRREDT